MSNGYATDSSTGSNKRLCFDEEVVDLTNSPGRRKPPPEITKDKGPLELALSTIGIYGNRSLHKSMNTTLSQLATDFIRKYARWFHKMESYLKQKNNPDFIPSDAKIKLDLHPVKSLEGHQGFLDVRSEAAEAVKQCHQLLREPVLKVTKLNADQLMIDAQKAFVIALPNIAELLCSEEDISNYDKHQAVANLMDWKRRECLDFIKLTEQTFITMYCEQHSLSTFPIPKRTTAHLQQARLQQTGGGNNDNNPPSQYPPNSGGDAAVVITQQTPGSQQGIGRGRGQGIRRTTNNGPTGNNNPPSSHSNQQQLTQGNATYLAIEAAAGAAPAATPNPLYENAAGATAGASTSDSASVNSHATAVVEAFLSPTQKVTFNAMSEEQQALIRNLMDTQNNVESSAQNGPNSPGGATSEITNEAIQNVNTSNPHGDNDVNMADATTNNNAQGRPIPTFNYAGDVLLAQQMEKISQTMANVIKGMYQNSILVFHRQLEANAKAHRIKKVATKQRVILKADATIQAMENETKADLKYVRVICKEEASAAVAASKAKERGKNASKKTTATTPAKNKSRGAKGGAAPKKKTPTDPKATNQKRGNHQPGGGNDSTKNAGNNGGPSSNEKSRRRKGASTTKRSKSKETPAKK